RNSDYQKINVCVGDVVGIASVKVESFAGIKAILKLPWNDGQDYIFTYYPFEDVS
ncbi:2990_t:CDS:1, partial [Rhizophagus irregularis]